MLKVKNWFHDRFGFSKREFNGLLGICALLLAITLSPYIYAHFKNKATTLTAADIAAVKKLVLVDIVAANKFHQINSNRSSSAFKGKVNLFNFDPNTIDLAGWQKLGLSVKQANAIINYLNKGGKFYKPEDLQKMYTITPQKYQDLLPYIQIKAQQSATKSKVVAQSEYSKKPISIIELNNADTLALDEIKGVGAAFARRIAKYRDRVGGFHRKEQLLEVFGVDSAKYIEIKDQVAIDASLIKKININTIQFEQLKNNPYLKWKQANAIINYRKQHGDYKSINDLKKVAILDETTLQKLTPYINY